MLKMVLAAASACCLAAGMLLLSLGVNALLRRAHAAEECVSK